MSDTGQLPDKELEVSSPRSDPPPDPRSQRLLSLDVYRGLIMLTLAFNGFGLAQTAKNHLETNPDSAFWAAVKYQFSHVEWVGCAYWDLIQPSFMFMVGVSMAYSYVRRKQAGQSYRRMLGHAITRSFILIFLGIFLISNWGGSTRWSMMNVLTQIGLGYTFLFLLWGQSFLRQATAAGCILTATWLLYVAYPHSGVDFPNGAPEAGVSSEWAADHVAIVRPSWHKNANVGHAIDQTALNWLPQAQPFTHSRGGYQTLNFLPSLATMIFGLMCGELLRSRFTNKKKLRALAIAGVAGLIVGQLLHVTTLCPIVKRIWTPSWAIFSTGWCCLILAALYGIVDVLKYRRWTFPLVVVGMNSIAIYSMAQLLKPWAAKTLQIHLGKEAFNFLGEANAPLVQYNLIGLMFWLICYWMYRNKFFVRI
ncbi:MAG: acyltransferase family protein [Verrucomicrobiia bacterium]|jgi:heparan-alpha-glucosaminide N-acetyltransferase